METPLSCCIPGVSDLRFWDDQMAAFSANHRVVRFDQRGSGLTSYPPRRSATMTTYAMLDYLGIEKAATSAAPSAAARRSNFALRYPERIAALVVVCGAVAALSMKTAQTTRFQRLKGFQHQLRRSMGCWICRRCGALTQYWFDGRVVRLISDPAHPQRAYDMLYT